MLPTPKNKPAVNAFAAYDRAIKTPTKPVSEKKIAKAVIQAPVKEPNRNQFSKRNWAVQVGAYADFTRARDAVLQATEQAPKHLRGGTVKIEPHLAHGSRLYRARIAEVSKTSAISACDVLKKRNKVCLPIPPSSEVALAD